MFENFDFGFDLPTVIVLIAFVAAFASVMAVATLFMQNDKFAARRRAVAFKRDELQIQQRESFQSRRRLQPTRSESAMRNVIGTAQSSPMVSGVTS